jgi:hypothetical protein
MEREFIFWFGLFVLTLTMTGGMWMFLESKRLYAASEVKKPNGPDTGNVPVSSA